MRFVLPWQGFEGRKCIIKITIFTLLLGLYCAHAISYPLERKINQIAETSIIQDNKTMLSCNAKLDLLKDTFPENNISTKLLNGGIASKDYATLQLQMQGHAKYAYKPLNTKILPLFVIKVFEKRYIFFSDGTIDRTWLLFTPYQDDSNYDRLCIAKLLSAKGTIAIENLVTDFHKRACFQSNSGLPTFNGGGEYRELLCQKSKYEGELRMSFDD